MQDETTTTESIDTQADESSQPEVNNNEAAENQAETTSQSSESSVAEPETDNSDETEIKEWAEKKGIKLDDPIAIAKLARETEKSFHAKSEEASKLKKTIGEQSSSADEGSIEAEAFPIINRLRVAEFYNEHPEAKQYDEKMASLVEEKPWLSQDLDVLLAVAKSESAGEATLEARQEGRKEALETQAKAQKAGAPSSTSTGKPKPAKRYTDADIANMSIKEYQALKESGFDPLTDIVD